VAKVNKNCVPLFTWLLSLILNAVAVGESLYDLKPTEILADSATSYDKLREIIRREKITSMATLLSAFKKEPGFSPFLKNFTLQYNSQSSQSAGVSPEFPRVIARNNKMILAFTGDPSSKENFGRLEIIEYESNSGDFKFREIVFGEGRPAQFHDSPESCVACHDGRPIWTGYQLWPGAYGSNNDLLVSPHRRSPFRFDERIALEKFLKQQLGTLYEQLDTSRYLPEQIKLNHEPNVTLTQHLSLLNTHRILTQLKSSDRYPLYEFALAAASYGCEGIERFLPAEERVLLERRVRGRVKGLPEGEVMAALVEDTANKSRERDGRLLRRFNEALQGKFTAREFAQEFEPEFHAQIDKVSALRYLAEGMGVDSSQFSLDRDPGHSGLVLSSPLLGAGDLHEYFLKPNMAKHLDSDKVYRDEYCKRLRELSLAALAKKPHAAKPAGH